MTDETPRAERGRPATRVGVVTSDRMEKSVVVRVDRTVRHGMYKRFVRLSSKFMAHDEANACKVGDTVEIVESRPLSRHKRWRVRRILRAAVGTGRSAESTPE
jgi:small subunit ribosomal protein S17